MGYLAEKIGHKYLPTTNIYEGVFIVKWYMNRQARILVHSSVTLPASESICGVKMLKNTRKQSH